ncbi:MAG TPA: transcriptional activator NhaR [Holophaga sp.]|nr:transcriptional activator NhaR [Holophaga sp.]
MEWLNYHHLFYFWTTVREGGVTRAAERLRLAQPTLSAQIRSLEAALGVRLFEKQGRGLAMTEAGRTAFRYAESIFGLGQEMRESLAGISDGSRPVLAVGISDALPKLMVRELLEPALHLPEAIRLVCREDRTERLLAQLTLHDLDLVLSDLPLPPGSAVKAFSHLLGECGVEIFGAAALRKAHPGAFPRCLEGAPFLLPPEGAALRRGLDQWFELEGVRPRIVGEFDDSALLKCFGQKGLGFFAAPAPLASEVERQYQVKRLGVARRVRERAYAITLDRRLRHPAVVAISEAARDRVFA